MGKLYTIDEKLLVGSNEVRIGDKVYPVDDRTTTVKKLMKIDAEDADAILRLAFGEKAFREIADMDLPFPAYLQLVKVTVAAMTGEEAEEVDARFQEATEKK